MRGISDKLHDSVTQGRLYNRLKASKLYDSFWRIVDPTVLEEREREIAFYSDLLHDLDHGSLIFDIGANHGYKTDIFLRLGARVVAVDPDPVNFTVLTRRFLGYRLNKKPVNVVNMALSSQVGSMTLWVDKPGSAKNTLNPKWVETLRDDPARFGEQLGFQSSREVHTTTVDELIRQFGRPYFVKIDVEGHELDVISGLSEPVPYISFEVNLPEFREEGVECVAKLKRLDSGSEFAFCSSVAAEVALSSWLSAEKIVDAIQTCEQQSIEVFCRTSSAI